MPKRAKKKAPVERKLSAAERRKLLRKALADMDRHYGGMLRRLKG